MSNKKLTILAIAAVVTVLWAVIQSRVSNTPPSEAGGPAYLIQGLDPADVGTIVLGTGEDEVVLKRDKGGFVVASKENYPAKTSEINSLLSKCLEIKTSEFVTDDPSNYEDLEVTEEKARNVVKLMTPEPNATILAGVVVGKTEELGQGTYVRLLSRDAESSSRVYVAPSVPWFSTGATSYIEQELITAKSEDIESVTVHSPNGQYILKKAEGGGDAVLENVPPGKKYKSSEGQSVFTALTSLRFDDVKRKSSDLKFDRQYVCRLKDSTVYTLDLAKKEDKTYAACKAEYTDTTQVTKGSDVESEEELKAKEAKLLARDNAQKFTANHQAWVYEIADWKAKNLTKELSDLLEEEKPEPEESAADPNATTPEPVDVPQIEDPNAVRTES